MKFFDLNTLDTNRKFNIVIGKRGTMKIIYYRGFKITMKLYHYDDISYYVYYVDDAAFLRLKDAKDYIERNYLK